MSTSPAQDTRYNGRCACDQRLSLKLTSTNPKSTHWVTCPSCGKRVKLQRVEGIFKESVKCDPRCTGAHGHTCTCSCGGANHGADHGMTQVVAVALAKPVAERRFIGEEGRHIVGMVTIATLTRNVGQYASTLITFQTDGGDVLKWFAPSDKVPEDWAVGRHFKLRAKVKRHQDDERYGKTTLVNYCEELRVTTEDEFNAQFASLTSV